MLGLTSTAWQFFLQSLKPLRLHNLFLCKQGKITQKFLHACTRLILAFFFSCNAMCFFQTWNFIKFCQVVEKALLWLRQFTSITCCVFIDIQSYLTQVQIKKKVFILKEDQVKCQKKKRIYTCYQLASSKITQKPCILHN